MSSLHVPVCITVTQLSYRTVYCERHYRKYSSSLGTLPPSCYPIRNTSCDHTSCLWCSPIRRCRHVSVDNISPSPNTTVFLCPQDVYLSVPTPSSGRSQGTPFCRHPPCTATCSVYSAELILGGLGITRKRVFAAGLTPARKGKLAVRFFTTLFCPSVSLGRGQVWRTQCTPLHFFTHCCQIILSD